MVGTALWALPVASSARISFAYARAVPAGDRRFAEWRGRPRMLEEARDDEQIIERVAALDIGKAEVVCCVRVPG